MTQRDNQQTVVVVGGGYGGLAAAARLAKLGHHVTLCERSGRLGGVLGTVERDGFRWDCGPATLPFPAPLRDLFRKSGRPLERVLELHPVTSPRRHVPGNGVLGDGTALDLPVSGRASQFQAINQTLGRAPAESWARLVDDHEDVWEVLRTRIVEHPSPATAALSRAERRRLAPRHSLRRAARRLRHPLLRRMLEHYAIELGSDPARTPAFQAVSAYLERTFGRWQFVGGFQQLVDALEHRLRERRVQVRYDAEVARIHTTAGQVSSVELTGGERLPATVVVSDIAPANLYGTLLGQPPVNELEQIRHNRPAQTPWLYHLGLRAPLPDLPHETVLHPTAPDEPTYVVRAPDDATLAPHGYAAWTVVVHPRPGHNTTASATADTDPNTPPNAQAVLAALAERGLDLRANLVLNEPGRHVAYAGLAWNGAETACRRAPNRSAVPGLYAVGSGAHPGPGLPFVALGAATVAEDLGRVARRSS